jgi:TRAP-type C4-dicarboxylate transport system permease large subunit
MSKKETRRAARQAYPKAKNATATKSKTKSGAYTRTAAGQKSRPAAVNRGPKPPRLKRSFIWGIVWAFVYFAVIEWLWRSGSTTTQNAVVAVIAVFLFTAVFYFTDKFKYRRYLRKQKDSSK